MNRRADRRNFFRELLRESASAVRGVQSTLQSSLSEPEVGDSPPQWSGWSQSPPRASAPTVRTASRDELLSLCSTMALETRSEDIVRLCRPSVRATPSVTAAGSQSRSRLGGSPDVPAGFEWPARDGRAFAFVGQFDLADLSRRFEALELPARGLLSFFVESARAVPIDDVPCRVLHFDEPEGNLSFVRPESQATLPDYPVELSLELTLPRSRSLAVEDLGLSQDEADAWDELRGQLASLQGVELEELSPDWLNLHRLLGYPEALGGEMEPDLELISPVSLEDDDESLTLDPTDNAKRWQLLLQVSDDVELRISADGGFGRLYFWIEEPDFQASSFDGARALLR